MIIKKLRHESKKLRDSARDQPCMVRLEGVCNFDPATTVLAHLNGGGAGTKHSDLFAAFCCSSCHDVLDGRRKWLGDPIEPAVAHFEGMVRTQQYWLDAGMVKIK